MFSYNRRSSGFSDTASLRRLFSGRRLSNASTLSVGTINTELPEYSAIDPNNLQEGPGHPATTSTPTLQLLHSEVVSDATTISDVEQLNVPAGGPVANLESAPRYSLIKSSRLDWRPDLSITAYPEPHEFHYSYPIKFNDPWATLHLRTCDAVPGNPNPFHTQPKIPHIWSCNPIAGMIDLDLRSLQTIHQIRMSLKGKLLTSSLQEGGFQFIHNELIVWQRTFGNPRHFKALESSPNEKFDGKLVGKYSFPFSFSFPTYVDAQSNTATLSDTNAISPFPALAPTPGSELTLSRPQDDTRNSGKTPLIPGSNSSTGTSSASEAVGTYPPDKQRPFASLQRSNDRSHIPSVASHVPQTFAERGIPVTVLYELSAIIIHGRFKTDSRIKTNIYYIPAIHPLPASQMRRDAYESNCHVPRPMDDPTGWFAIPKARSFGMFSDDLGQREVAIDCTLYVAEPLSYSRGAVITCFLELSSNDIEVLRRVGVPKLPVVRLVRRLRYFTSDAYTLDHERFGHMTAISGFTSPSNILLSPAGAGSEGKTRHFSVMAHEVGKASWRVPSTPNTQRASVKLLQGEIHLRDDLMPSCSCDILHVEYFVEMMALQSRHFEAILPPPARGRAGRHSIASMPVEIMSLRRVDEPTPVGFTEAPKPYTKRIHIEDTILEVKETDGVE